MFQDRNRQRRQKDRALSRPEIQTSATIENQIAGVGVNPSQNPLLALELHTKDIPDIYERFAREIGEPKGTNGARSEIEKS